jgi:ABC-2 type transport system permease protein
MSGTLRPAGEIVRNDLRRRLRNRSFLLQAFVAPIVIAVLISAAFGGGFGLEAEVEVVVQDHSDLATELQEQLVAASGRGITFVAVEDLAEANDRVERAQPTASAIVIPDGFAASLASPRPLPLEVLVTQRNVFGTAVARAVAADVAARINAGRLATIALVTDGRTAPDPATLDDLVLPITVSERSTGNLSPAANVGPGIGLLFLFLSVALVARSLLAERRLRVLDRIRAAPVSVTAILLGKCGGVILLGCVSMFVLWGATVLFLGATWGDPLGVTLLIVASSASVAGVAGVVAAFAQTEQSADLIATGVAFVFGIVGGSLVPLSQLPDGLLRFTFFTPNGWALHGFAELAAGEGSGADALPYAGVLLLWGLVAGTIAAVLLPRRLDAR